MLTVLGIGRAGSECLFQKVDANTFGAADFIQCGRNPWLALDHFCEQSQTNRHNFAIMGQPRSN